MQHSSVKKLFSEQAEYYSLEDQTSRQSPLIELFLKWSHQYSQKRLRVCEFGGAGGILLNELIKKSKTSIEVFNAEIIDDYRRRQIHRKIRFCQSSILDSKFSNASFDCLIIRDVLHHLVGKNFSETRINQKLALKELKRLVRPSGIILIEELVTGSKLAGRIIYYCSKLNTKLGIRISSLEINPHAVIAMFSADELLNIARDIFGSKISQYFLKDFDNSWRARLVHLGLAPKKMFFLLKV